MTKHALNRREFLTLTAAAALSLVARSQIPAVATLQRGQQVFLAEQLVALLQHTESAKVIGREYLRTNQQEANTALLLDRIAVSLSSDAVGLLGMIGPHSRALLARTMREDFASDRIVKLHGWILSLTEVRICALAALI